MKAKSLSFLIMGIFVLALASIASAATISDISDLQTTSGTFTFNTTITGTEGENVNLSFGNNVNLGAITFSVSPTNFVLVNTTREVTITYIVPSGFDFDFGDEYSTTLTANGNVSGSDTELIAFQENNDLCSAGNPGNLEVEIRDIALVSGYGDEDEWYPFDEFEVEVRIENNGNEDIDNIQVEWGVWDSDRNEWIIDLDEVEEFDIKDDEDEVFTFNFNLNDDLDIDVEDLQEGNYVLYVTANGEVDTSSNPETCESDSLDADIIIDKDFVVLNNLEIPKVLPCDSNIQISGEVWNIGSRDQDDVSVRVVSTNLDLEEIVVIGDIDTMENADFNFNFEISDDVEAGNYYIKFEVLDEDDDLFENGDNDESVFEVLTIVGEDCSALGSDVDVTVKLESGGKAGKPVVVRATILNSGENTATYTLNPAGYASWAKSAILSEETLSLNSGISRDVLITLDVKEDAIGENGFSLEIVSNGKLIASQPVLVTVEESSFLSGLINEDNWQIWGIGALNVILIVIIIIVAIRIARK